MEDQIREYLANIGAKGGAKSRRKISPEQQAFMQKRRREVFDYYKRAPKPPPDFYEVEICRNAPSI